VEAHFAVHTAGTGWTPARALADSDSSFFADHLATWRTTRLASDAVAASLMLLEHTRMLAWPVLACALRHGTWLDPSIDNVALDDRAPQLGFARGPETGLPDVADRVLPALLDTHLDPIVAALRTRTRAGRRTLWSNVAAGIAGGYLALSWTRPDRAHYVDAARAALSADPRTRGFVDITVGEHGGERWMRIVRRGCCLAFRCGPPRAHFCGTCPLVDEAVRRERFANAAAHYRELTDVHL
jgi:ferric iron reductase protein FhuF